MLFRRDCFLMECPSMSVPSTRVPIRHNISAHPMDSFFHIDWMSVMHAQERKDFRRVQQSRALWKKRAVRRGEDRRRSQERRNEVERSREAWRDRALAADHRIAQREMAHHQLNSVITQARQPQAIDTTNFFCAMFISISCGTVTCLSERRAECPVPCRCLRLV